MKYVLDTNIVSEGTKPAPDPRCVKWLLAHTSECCITTITLSELRYGVERLPDGKKRRELETKVAFIRQNFREWILPFDELAAVEFGRYVAEFAAARGLAAVEDTDVRDLQIASIARANGWTVVTRNIGDFQFVNTFNPFST